MSDVTSLEMTVHDVTSLEMTAQTLSREVFDLFDHRLAKFLHCREREKAR